MNEWISTIENGLSYNGSALHMLINYFLIGVSLLPYVVSARGSKASASWGWTFLIALIVQVLLWFTVGAVGVSVIWSAMTGFLLVDLRRRGLRGDRQSGLFLFSLLMGFCGILYYGVTFPMISTLAHAMALLMGVGLFFLLASKQKTEAV